MSELLPVVYLARHGDTAWTKSGQHTGLIDLLTEDGERNAQRLGERMKGMKFAKVFTKPVAARCQDLRAGRIWNCRGKASCPRGVGLREI